MIAEFYPWRLEIDVKSTEELYSENDYSSESDSNREFADSLSEEQLKFFASIGVDLQKADIKKEVYSIPAENGMRESEIYKMTVDFLIKGRMLAIPEYQKDIYSDEEVFGEEFPDDIEVVRCEGIPVYDNGIGMGTVFKHPCVHYDDSLFSRWDCGYILGSILIMKEITE